MAGVDLVRDDLDAAVTHVSTAYRPAQASRYQPGRRVIAKLVTGS